MPKLQACPLSSAASNICPEKTTRLLQPPRRPCYIKRCAVTLLFTRRLFLCHDDKWRSFESDDEENQTVNNCARECFEIPPQRQTKLRWRISHREALTDLDLTCTHHAREKMHCTPVILLSVSFRIAIKSWSNMEENKYTATYTQYQGLYFDEESAVFTQQNFLGLKILWIFNEWNSYGKRDRM